MKRISTWAGGLTVLVAATLVAGCGGPPPSPAKGGTKVAQAAQDGGHEHGTGPHGGTVADWGGGKYHIEFTIDHKKQEARVYILGSDEKTPAPVKAKELLLTIQEPAFQVTLKADPQKGDPPGTASCFAGTHERLGKEQEFAGTISAEVDGTPYAGDFKEEPEKPAAPKK
jgi:hypothetical protein